MHRRLSRLIQYSVHTHQLMIQNKLVNTIDKRNLKIWFSRLTTLLSKTNETDRRYVYAQ